MFSQEIISQAATLIKTCAAKGIKITTAESCTGGLVAALLTEISGASAVFDGGFVTYSNELKEKLLGINAMTIAEHGAVSERVATEMAKGAVAKTGADISVAITGIAGPSGGSTQKPVGLVYIAVASRNGRIFPSPSSGEDVLPISFAKLPRFRHCKRAKRVWQSSLSAVSGLLRRLTPPRNDKADRWQAGEGERMAVEKNIFSGNRSEIRLKAVEYALNMLQVAADNYYK